jgi:serine/threonine-protein kinase RsbW
MASRELEVHLVIGSRFENIELAQVVIDDSLKRLDFNDDARYWIGIAVREAVANAIKHGNRQDPGKQVEVEVAVEAEDVVIRIQDEGAGFDPEQVADPLATENLLRPDGRGIFYMKKFMDGIDYRALPHGGTEVTMRKRLASLRKGSKGKKKEER